MAELLQQERLQPSLLDRLTDEEPTKTQESRDERVLSLRQLRQGVLRDLAWLFSTANLGTSQDLDDYSHVERSVLNYGLPSLTGYTGIGLDLAVVERALHKAIRNFEPRVLAKTLRVKLLAASEKRNPNALGFVIEGDLWAQPLPQKLYLRTELDVEMGNIEIVDNDRRGPR